MNKVLDMMERELKRTFTAGGYEDSFAKVVLSNHPDLCEYQRNGATVAAKAYKKKPIDITSQVMEQLASGGSHLVFSEARAVMPGFTNLKLSDAFLTEYVGAMASTDELGLEALERSETIIVDYDGASVAKPLHVSHLRTIIIGESIKRMGRFLDHHMIGDVRLGDWGLQMGLIVEELEDKKPGLVYFDESFEGSFPQEVPFTISELEKIYPAASAKSKVDEAFKERTHQVTSKLQRGYALFRAIWQHIMAASVSDLKKSCTNLSMRFDLWKGESGAKPYVGDMIQMLVSKGLAYESQGTLVVDAAQDTDAKEVPPYLIRKSGGTSLYATSDLATIVERGRGSKPDRYIYVVGKHQGIRFEQVFRVAKRAGIVKEDAPMIFLGFGIINGKDGRPFKTCGGGVMRLEELIKEINEAIYKRIMENRTISEDETGGTAIVVGPAALKYSDLSNQAAKDYVFGIECFTSFEGNTGPCTLYTIVRIKSIITKYRENGDQVSQDAIEKKTLACTGSSERALMLMLARYNEVLENSLAETAPHKICQHIYELANTFNSFYHDTKILAKEDEAGEENCIGLISLTRRALETCIELLGVKAPECMQPRGCPGTA